MVCKSTASGPKDVVGAHIWPHHTGGRGLENFGLEDSFVWRPRNALLLLKTVEKSFDHMRAGFFYDGTSFKYVVLDPALLQETASEGVTFASLHDTELQLPSYATTTNAFPCRRLLAWHFTQVCANALKNYWCTEADLSKYSAVDMVDAWLRDCSPEAKWPGVQRAGLAALRAVQNASVFSEGEDGDDYCGTALTPGADMP
jgi:hypothetical protein